MAKTTCKGFELHQEAEQERTILRLRAEQICTGALVLVNREHPWNWSTPIPLCEVGRGRQSVLLHHTPAMSLEGLLDSLKLRRYVTPTDGYRSLADQEKERAEAIEKEGLAFAEKYVALPGCSEHHTGLAVDLSFPKKSGARALRADAGFDAHKRFREAAANYGFVERYSRGKEQITGISYEPWHYRYVGIPHAQIMCENDSTLEEYHFFLRHFSAQKPLRYHIGQQHYEIFYVPLEDNAVVSIDLSGCSSYAWSGDNVGGFFVWKLL